MTYDPQADKGTSSCWACAFVSILHHVRSQGPAKRGAPGSSRTNCCPFIVRSCWLLRRDAKAESETCVYARSGRCEAAARVLNIVKGNTFGEREARRDENRKGHPLDQIQIIRCLTFGCRKHTPSDERALVFIQTSGVVKKVAEALNANKVRFLEIEGPQRKRARIQNNSLSEERVLLHVMDESASGRCELIMLSFFRPYSRPQEI
ncbi:hypothetical protein BJV78DRAFT_1174938 [Lactifluus subvellereus]|nr:hypothetical protein BJV78DRAFT_1174938 [Lactifluus subvellereus]